MTTIQTLLHTYIITTILSPFLSSAWHHHRHDKITTWLQAYINHAQTVIIPWQRIKHGYMLTSWQPCSASCYHRMTTIKHGSHLHHNNHAQPVVIIGITTNKTWLHAYIITFMLRQLLSSHDNDLNMVSRLHHNNHAQPFVIIAWQRYKYGYTLTS